MLTSAADILNVSTGLCFSNNNFYQLAPLLAVRVQNGVLWTADARETAWPQRHCSVLHELNRTLHTYASRVRPLDATFAIWPHDGCSRDVPITHLAYALSADCPRAIALPWMPTEHNPLRAYAATRQRAEDIYQQLDSEYPWASKRPTAYWRGSASDGSSSAHVEEVWKYGSRRGARARLAVLSRLYPRLIDARITQKNQRFHAPPNLMNASGSLAGALNPGWWTVVQTGEAPSPFRNAFGHKFVVDVGGVGGSFRLPSLLLGNSVVLMQSSYSFWWSQAFANVTVPITPDLSDLLAAVRRLQADEKLAMDLVERMHSRVRAGHLSDDAVARRWVDTLVRLARGAGEPGGPAAHPREAGLKKYEMWIGKHAMCGGGGKKLRPTKRPRDKCRLKMMPGAVLERWSETATSHMKSQEPGRHGNERDAARSSDLRTEGLKRKTRAPRGR